MKKIIYTETTRVYSRTISVESHSPDFARSILTTSGETALEKPGVEPLAAAPAPAPVLIPYATVLRRIA